MLAPLAGLRGGRSHTLVVLVVVLVSRCRALIDNDGECGDKKQ